MATLPPVHVLHYEDGPDMPVIASAERAYRQAFYTAVREASRMSYAELQDAIKAAWNNRWNTRREFEVRVPTYVRENLPDRPDLDGEQFIYIAGYETDAARARGRVQGMEIARQFWDELKRDTVPENVVQAFVMQPWAERLEPWVTGGLDKLIVPVRPYEMLGPQQRQLLGAFKPRGNLVSLGEPVSMLPSFRNVRELLLTYHWLKTPVIEGLLRQGETMNIISAPKLGKSWLATDLAIAVATGGLWLDTFPTRRGDVLLIDNELHAETIATRFPKVAEARGIPLERFREHLFVENLRGRLTSLLDMGPYFQAIEPGQFSLIVLDALYRLLPSDSSENDNSVMANVYNTLDRIAGRLACAIVCVHHSSKGLQSGKAVTDVGAGAGSQARATDTHLILRPHQEPDAVVLEAAVRSWPPVEPICLRWNFPVWNRDDTLDPGALKSEWPKRRRQPKPEGDATPAKTEWTPEEFADAFVTSEPQQFDAIAVVASEEGLSKRRAKDLLKKAEQQGAVHRWKFGSTKPVAFATTPQAGEVSEVPACARTPPITP